MIPFDLKKLNENYIAKTKNGKNVEILDTKDKLLRFYPLRVRIENMGSFRYTKDGHFSMNDKNNPFDLIMVQKENINKIEKEAWYKARNEWCPSCRNRGKCKQKCINNYNSRYTLVREFISGYIECYLNIFYRLK